MKTIMLRAYSLASYLIGMATVMYLIFFIGDLWVSVTINHASHISPQLNDISAVLWNSLLILIWGGQHSLMARPAFKRVWTRLVPKAVERSTYLIAVAVITSMLVLFWVPMPAQIWETSGSTIGSLILGLYFAGWSIVFISTFLINHLHLFGLQQAFQAPSRSDEKEATFRTPLFYKLVRHPMMTGMLIAIWAAPDLSLGRVLFNFGMTAYILIGLVYEERDLLAELGESYRRYRKQVPMLIPGLKPGN